MNDNSAQMSNNPSVSSDVNSDQPNQNQQSSNQPTNSYVDAYQPPIQTPAPQEVRGSVEAPQAPAGANDTPVSATTTSSDANDKVSFDDLIKSSVSNNVPASPSSDEPVTPEVYSEPAAPLANVSAEDEKPAEDEKAEFSTSNSSETLEDQNIFSMLGVEDGTEELKENFLNELQDVIWDDFLENDVDLLITSDEKVRFDQIMAKKETTDQETTDGVAKSTKTDEKVQDELVAYLETLIPDLEDIMLEKALDLKADLFAERIIGMKEYHANSPEKLKLVNDAEKMMQEDKWYSAAQLLNGIDTK